jgi:hypothetical protein
MMRGILTQLEDKIYTECFNAHVMTATHVINTNGLEGATITHLRDINMHINSKK